MNLHYATRILFFIHLLKYLIYCSGTFSVIYKLILCMPQPAWVLKSAKENCVQRLVHMSADLAGQTGSLLGTIENGIFKEVMQVFHY